VAVPHQFAHYFLGKSGSHEFYEKNDEKTDVE